MATPTLEPVVIAADDVPRAPLFAERRSLAIGLTGLVAVLALVCAASLAIGAKSIPIGEVWRALVHPDLDRNSDVVVRMLRVPRTEVGLMVGIALGLAGAVMQGVTRNPLADPGVLGVNAGAALAIVIGIAVFDLTSLSSYVWFAFVGAAVASIAVYTLGALGREGATPVKLALAGAAMTVLLGSLTSAVLLADLATLDQFRFWAVGSLSGRGASVAATVLPFVAVGVVLTLASARALNGLALGDDVASALGQRVGLTRLTAVVCVMLLCGAAVAAAGPIAFVGLMIPHVARAITGPDYRWVLAYSMVLGPILLLSADIIGRVVIRPGELQVGIVTAIIGAPFFIVLVRRKRLAAL